MLAVPGLHDVAHEIEHMPIGWVLVAIGLEVLSCIGYVVIFLRLRSRTDHASERASHSASWPLARRWRSAAPAASRSAPGC